MLLVLLLSTVARAEAPMSAGAKEQLELGLREYAVGKWAEAIAAFRRGYELEPRPELLYALAQAQRMSGDCPSAVQSYRAFLRTAPPSTQATSAQQNLERCERTIAEQEEQQRRRQPAQAALVTVEKPHRPWQKDVAGGVLVGVGAAVAATGAVLWGVGEQAIDALADAPSYDRFGMLTAAAATGESERAVGIAAIATGGVLVLAGVIRWSLVARRR